jgi:hypothetical protein
MIGEESGVEKLHHNNMYLMSNIRRFSRSFANLANFADMWTRKKMQEEGNEGKKEGRKDFW